MTHKSRKINATYLQKSMAMNPPRQCDFFLQYYQFVLYNFEWLKSFYMNCRNPASIQHLSSGDRLTIYFHAVLSKDFKFEPELDRVFMRAGDHIGNWKDDLVELFVSRLVYFVSVIQKWLALRKPIMTNVQVFNQCMNIMISEILESMDYSLKGNLYAKGPRLNLCPYLTSMLCIKAIRKSLNSSTNWIQMELPTDVFLSNRIF